MNRSAVYDDRVHCIADLEKEGMANLPRMVAGFFSGGSMDLLTRDDNKLAYDRYRLRPRVLIDVTNVDTSTVCLDKVSAFPMGIAPAANHALAHPSGEVGTSRAAARKGVHMALSVWSNYSTADVCQQAKIINKGDIAYCQQLCVLKDVDLNLNVLKRAEAAGCKALFVTVDCPWLGRRLNEFKNTFSLPSTLKFPNIPEIDEPQSMVTTDERIAYDAALIWQKIQYFKQHTKMQIWLKGILTAEDAELAVQHGADGIIVSNHGGRQLDGTLATLDALPEVVNAVRGRIPVHIDGGIRRGSDIFKALALGADYCWVGRIPLWGLAYKGEEGVSIALNILHDEFKLVMALMGCKTVKDITAKHLARLQSDGLYKPVEEYEWRQRLREANVEMNGLASDRVPSGLQSRL